MITELHLENFMLFTQAHFAFCRHINVFVGENATGKTNLLKNLYGFTIQSYNRKLNQKSSDESTQPLTVNSSQEDQLHQLDYLRLFNIETDDDLNSLYTGEPYIGQCSESLVPGNFCRPVFIPSLDMLAHSKRFLSTWDLYKIDFDQTYRDIVALLLSPERRSAATMELELSWLTSGFANNVEEREERFYLDTEIGSIPATLIAEGMRKLATLIQLIKNGWIRPGSVLLWDEPEANLSPILLKRLTEALLTLANAGVQIFIATHSYELLQELDLQGAGSVKYFALERTENGVVPHPADTYAEIAPNKIAEEFDSIYNRVVAKATGRQRTNGARH